MYIGDHSLAVLQAASAVTSMHVRHSPLVKQMLTCSTPAHQHAIYIQIGLTSMAEKHSIP